jgi:hypothetical protein
LMILQMSFLDNKFPSIKETRPLQKNLPSLD